MACKQINHRVWKLPPAGCHCISMQNIYWDLATTISRLVAGGDRISFEEPFENQKNFYFRSELSYVLSWQHHTKVIYFCVLKLMSCVRTFAWMFSWPPGFLQRLSLFNQLRHITYRYALLSKWCLFSCCLTNYERISFSFSFRYKAWVL